MDDKSKNEGITLIALIITIIVMLILAGISMLAIVGDNGILEQAISSSEETDIADTYDQIQLTLVGYYDEQGKYTEANVWEAVDAVLGSDAERNTTAYTVQTEKGNTVDLQALIDGASDKKYKITVSLNGITAASTNATTIGKNEKVTLSYSLEEFYRWPYSISVTNGTYSWDDGTLEIGDATDDIEIEIYGIFVGYAGYYADVDNDGNVDGVIYADLVASLDISYDGVEDFHIDSVDEDELKQYKISDDYYERNIRNSKSY